MTNEEIPMLVSSPSTTAAIVTAGTSTSSQDGVVMSVSPARPVTRSIQIIGEPEVGTSKETTEGRTNEAPIPLREERSSLGSEIPKEKELYESAQSEYLPTSAEKLSTGRRVGPPQSALSLFGVGEGPDYRNRKLSWCNLRRTK